MASKIYDEAISSNEFTFEGWVKTENLTQLSATIFSISSNTTTRRNFKLNQQGNYIQTWLRVTSSSETGSLLNSPGQFTNK